MTYTFEDLKADVTKEAQALRVHATEEERGRLDYKELRPENQDHCIYGQMANGCYSARAAELIKACTPVFLDKIHEVAADGIEGIACLKVSSEDSLFMTERTSAWGMNARYSAIEVYILLPEAKNANLISFLRGETNDLDL